MFLRLTLCLLLLATAASAQRDTPRPAAEFGAWQAEFRERAIAEGIDAAVFDAAFAGVTYQAEIVRLDRNQSEFTKTIWEYLDTAVSGARIANGRRALERQRVALAGIEDRWGVPAEIVVAIWGLESSYGAVRGGQHTVEALATLAFDGRRAELFEAQVLAALRIQQAGEVAPDAMRGSWAGAMGHTQFLPTSYLDHAVDWDGDGRRDIWGDDPVDALASAAAYLAANGWTRGQPWGVEVVLPDGFDYAATGEVTEKSAAEWSALGVVTATGEPLPPGDAISIRVPGGHTGAAFATWPNFRALESYNTADAYVIGVGHLADRIAGRAALRSGWPRGDRALSFDERVELQRRLAAAGFDPLKFDGRIGPLTLAATRGWQESVGLVPDGYAPPALLDRLRRETP